MTFVSHKGATVYGVAGYKNHLIILCTDPIFWPKTGCKAVLSVNVSSWRENSKASDSSCILDVGDHSFIKHKSFVYYEAAVPLRLPHLNQRVEDGELIPYEDLRPEVLDRILKGFYKSERTPRQALVFLKQAQSEE